MALVTVTAPAEGEGTLEERVAEYEVYCALLEHRVAILQRRLEHQETECAQARVSRDIVRDRLHAVLNAIHASGLEVHGLPNDVNN